MRQGSNLSKNIQLVHGEEVIPECDWFPSIFFSLHSIAFFLSLIMRDCLYIRKIKLITKYIVKESPIECVKRRRSFIHSKIISNSVSH